MPRVSACSRPSRLIDVRASLLSAGRIVDDIALDKYSFIRDGYISRRRSLVYDGDPPEIPEPKDDDAGRSR